jgi:hypothetical protein
LTGDIVIELPFLSLPTGTFPEYCGFETETAKAFVDVEAFDLPFSSS